MAKQQSTKPAEPEQPGFFSSWRGWFMAALLVAGIVVAVLHWGDVKRFGKLLTEARPLWLLIAAALQFATYVGLAAQWWLTLRRGRTPEEGGDLLRLTFAKHFADQVIPTAGMSGNVLLVDRLVGLGVPRENAVAALLLQIIAYYLSYALGALWVLVVLWWKSRSSWLLTAAVLVFLVVAAGIPWLTLWLHRRGQHRIPRWIARWSKAKHFFELVGEAPSKLVRDPPHRLADHPQPRRVRRRRSDDAGLHPRTRSPRTAERRICRLHVRLDRGDPRPDPDGARLVRSGQHRHAPAVRSAFRGGAVGDPAVPRVHALAAADSRRHPAPPRTEAKSSVIPRISGPISRFRLNSGFRGRANGRFPLRMLAYSRRLVFVMRVSEKLPS